MKISKLIEHLRNYDLNDDVYIQAGFNRFHIKEISISEDDGVIIITDDDADNPKPYKPSLRRA